MPDENQRKLLHHNIEDLMKLAMKDIWGPNGKLVAFMTPNWLLVPFQRSSVHAKLQIISLNKIS